jgi:hypothetical protein
MTDKTLKIVSIFALAIICLLAVGYVIFPDITLVLSGSALSNYPDSNLLRYPGIMP